MTPHFNAGFSFSVSFFSQSQIIIFDVQKDYKNYEIIRK